MLRATLYGLLACSLLTVACSSGDDEPGSHEPATPSGEVDGGTGGSAGHGGDHETGGTGGAGGVGQSGGAGGMDPVAQPDAGDSGVLPGDGGLTDSGMAEDASQPQDAALDAELPDEAGMMLDADIALDADVALDATVAEDAAVMMDAALPDDGGVGVPDAAIDAGGPAPADPHDWSSFGGDLDHSRTAHAETAIDADSAATLRLAWRVPASGVTGTPAIVNGVVYFADWAGAVRARNISDGSELWTRTLPEGFTTSPCVVGDRVYLSDRHATIYALDRATGATVWSTLIDTTALTHLWSSPVVADGVVIVGTSSYGTQENRTPLPQQTIATFRGAIVGLDAEDGQVLWRFETTRPVGQPDIYGPGVSVWGSGAIDTERKAVFIGTGNGYATPVSPYSDALLAIDYRTGVLAWHTQFTANDAYSSGSPSAGPDYDVGATPNLFTIDDDGIARDVVGVGDKSGVYRVLDRDSGDVIWTRSLEPGLFISSRKTGGIIAPAAYAEGRIYVASNTSSAASKVWALDAETGAIDWVSDSVNSVNFGGPAVANDVVFFGGSGFAVNENRGGGIGVGAPGNITAYEASTGTVVRNLTLFAGRGGGFAIAHGRVFIGSGFSFFAVADEPLAGALEAFEIVP